MWQRPSDLTCDMLCCNAATCIKQLEDFSFRITPLPLYTVYGLRYHFAKDTCGCLFPIDESFSLWYNPLIIRYSQ